MALSATIYKSNLNITDMDPSYFSDHALTLALHPSENELRMRLRLT
ncbi:MAG: YaeQ family protein, partial [Gammaproteobacteria bacterium]|nr:YaeQ family protein [Gammaproteobacteria bacterium]